MTTEGQGRTSDPVGFGIPVLIEGPWSGPRIYPEMQGILDNPDAAYAKLREMGKGLFGPNGANLGNIGGLLGSLTGNPPANSGNGGNNNGNGSNDALGGNIAGTIGSLMKSFGGSRSIPAPGQQPSSPPAQAQAPSQAPPSAPGDQAQSDDSTPQDSQPMNDVLRQLFNRQ